MVARRRKRAAGESDSGVPTLPGYSAIPIKFSEKQQSSHYLYVREHKVREGTKSSWPQKRTLFVLNVPPYCTEECLSRLLSPCGPVQSVELQEKPELAESPKEPPSKFFHPKPVPGFQVAYVLFRKPGGVSAALALKGPLLVSTESHPVRSGVLKWIRDYTDSVPDPEALRVEVDAFMETYDRKIAEVGLPLGSGWPGLPAGGGQGQGGGRRPRRGGLGEGDPSGPPAGAPEDGGGQPAGAGAGEAEARPQGTAQLLRLAAPRDQDGAYCAAAQEVRGGQAENRADAGPAQVPTLLSLARPHRPRAAGW
ncbi:ribosomal RNA-processing protein 7 homolog A isoform X1 [Moschus berezovskii]|uniref:ribosomal RNA-processing protein 7 homolog A isoform X1 n=1 Tax=Moschus berezovskii TaxID=68408 RepID=UPI002444E49C|nr:ribosomal RNA-processing protein 7 homolog A isoform X1 [Moschus berezovskii]